MANKEITDDVPLFFVTYRYPFYPREYFIEKELEVLSRNFSRIYVVPAKRIIGGVDGEPRKMPKNCILIDGRNQPQHLRLYWLLLAVLRFPAIFFAAYRGARGVRHLERRPLIFRVKQSFKVSLLTVGLRQIAAKFNATQLIGYSYWRDASAAALSFLRAEQTIARLYVRCHGGDIYSDMREPFECLIHQEAEGVFPVSSNGREFLVEKKGFKGENIEVKRLGVELPIQCSTPSHDGVWRILSCSMLIPIKRVDFIAEVIGKLDHNVIWTHIGVGGDGLDAAKKIVARFDDRHRGKFMGALTNREVFSFYKTNPLDLFVNLSLREGIPVSIMEALAHGVPVVATDVGGTSELVDERVGALVKTDHSSDEVAEVISRILKGDIDLLRKNARQVALDMCSSDKNFQDFADCLKTG